MFRRAITPLSLLLFGLVSQFVLGFYAVPAAEKLATTFYVAAGISFVAWLIWQIGNSYISSSRHRYTLRKTVSVLFTVLIIIVAANIWVEDPQTLFVAYGLVAAGVAVSLQDIFKNFAGGVAILSTGMYRVGNRIEVDGVQGDVIDTGIFYTTLLEVGNWVDGDQSTGRIVTVPNGKVLDGAVNNYTRDHHYLWDEIAVPITHESDMKKAAEILREVAGEYASEFSKEASESLSHMGRRYYVVDRDVGPTVFTQLTDNWILLTVRYVVEVRERRVVASNISEAVIERLRDADGIDIASETLDIVDPTGDGGKLGSKDE